MTNVTPGEEVNLRRGSCEHIAVWPTCRIVNIPYRDRTRSFSLPGLSGWESCGWEKWNQMFCRLKQRNQILVDMRLDPNTLGYIISLNWFTLLPADCLSSSNCNCRNCVFFSRPFHPILALLCSQGLGWSFWWTCFGYFLAFCSSCTKKMW